MIRNFNYTGRKRIQRDRVSVALRDAEGGTQAFDAAFTLDGLALPPGARVYVEAYYRAFWRRFPYGTVSRPEPPEDRVLPGVGRHGTVFFRVNVVDDTGDLGLILASADRIRPLQPGEEPGRRSILPVQWMDLGDQVWRLHVEPASGPVLELNNRIPEIDQRARHDPAFAALVFPAVLREVLMHAAILAGPEDSEEPEGWQGMWFRFAQALHPGPRPEAEEDENFPEVLGWIDDVVAAFCQKYRTRDQFLRSLTPGAA